MDNQELLTFFEAVDNETNCFNKIEYLKANKKRYKKSAFYKNTRMPIEKAYKMYQLSRLEALQWLITNPLLIAIVKGDQTRIAMELESLVASFDFTKLDIILDYIADKLTNIDFSSLKKEMDKAIKDIGVALISKK